MQILRASEDYLETMLMMKEKHGYIRSIDIAEYLGVTKPSVSYATKRLRESGYITMDKEGLITLTDTGMAIAASMLDRHKTLTQFLIHLGVDPETAEADACKMEHDISPLRPSAATPAGQNKSSGQIHVSATDSAVRPCGYGHRYALCSDSQKNVHFYLTNSSKSV
jgi:DtxR family Mn-dependent transcriptional regulator